MSTGKTSMGLTIAAFDSVFGTAGSVFIAVICVLFGITTTAVKDLAGCCQYSSPITKGAADSNIRIGTLSGHDQNTPRRSKIQKLNATAA